MTRCSADWQDSSPTTRSWSPSPGSPGRPTWPGYAAEGARVVLVGEALVKDGDPEGAVRALRQARDNR